MGLTKKRDLRDGAAVWTAFGGSGIKARPLPRSTRAEVVIVGAGISGSILAQSLTEVGLRPLIVDRRRAPLSGSTAASTALLQFELDTPLTKLSASIGKRAAERVWIASRDAVNELRTRSHRLKIDADLITRPSLYLAGNVLDRAGLRRESRRRQVVGLSSEWLDGKALRYHFGPSCEAALLSHGNLKSAAYSAKVAEIVALRRPLCRIQVDRYVRIQHNRHAHHR